MLNRYGWIGTVVTLVVAAIVILVLIQFWIRMAAEFAALIP